MPHFCHAHGCRTPVPPRRFVCRVHWLALSPALRGAINREYRPGQEIDKKPSARYMAVQQLAMAELAFKPRDEAAAQIAGNYVHHAVEWRYRAIAAGAGDPLEGLLLASRAT